MSYSAVAKALVISAVTEKVKSNVGTIMEALAVASETAYDALGGLTVDPNDEDAIPLESILETSEEETSSDEDESCSDEDDISSGEMCSDEEECSLVTTPTQMNNVRDLLHSIRFYIIVGVVSYMLGKYSYDM